MIIGKSGNLGYKAIDIPVMLDPIVPQKAVDAIAEFIFMRRIHLKKTEPSSCVRCWLNSKCAFDAKSNVPHFR